MWAVLAGLSLGIVGRLPAQATSGPSTGVIYDCAATSLYVMANLSGKSLTYERATELLPVNHEGNSLAQVSSAVDAVGFTSEVVSMAPNELVGLQVPMIGLETPSDAPGGEWTRRDRVGHYIVVRPLEGGLVQLLDYPREPVVLAVDDWIAHLNNVGVGQLRAVLCGAPGQELEQMVRAVTPSSGPSTTPARPSLLEARDPVRSVAVLSADGRRSPVAVWSFGDVSEGATISHTFTIRNESGRPVRIAKLANSCGSCVEAKASTTEEIPASGEVAISVVASLAQRFGTVRLDTAVYFTPESKHPPVLLSLSGNVHARWVCVPPIIDLGRVRPEDGPIATKAEVRATEYGRREPLPTAVSRSPAIQVSLGNATTKADTYSVQIVFEPRSVVGQFAGQVEIRARGQDVMAALLEVRAFVMSEVSITPTKLLLGGQQATGDSRAALVASHAERKRLKLSKAEVKSESQLAQALSLVAEAAAGEAGELKLNARFSRMPSTPFEGTIQLELGVDGTDQIYRVSVPFVYAP
jgi:hypothetical protein